LVEEVRVVAVKVAVRVRVGVGLLTEKTHTSLGHELSSHRRRRSQLR
jgi:hypothetical protein